MTTSETAVEEKLGARGDAVHRARERKRTLARAVRRSLLLLAILGTAAGGVLALRPRPVTVEVARVTRGPLATMIEETGTARVKDRYVVSAPVTGSLARLGLEAGDVVREGDTLAEIAPAVPPLLDQRSREEGEARRGAALSALGQARAQQARATAAKDQASRELDRVRKLVASKSVADVELEGAEFALRMRTEEEQSAEFAVKVASEEERLAEVALGRDTTRTDRHIDVVSPISGVVLRVDQKSAGVVNAGAPLVEVGDAAQLEIVVDLLTTDAVRVKVGSPVVIQGWGGDATLAGKVHRIEPSAFTKPSALGVDEQRVNVVVALIEPREKWAELADGYRVEARLSLWQSPDVVKAPEGAVFRRGDGWAAYVVQDGIAKIAPVEIGHRGETEVEIVSGLAPDATVVVHPSDRVKEGARVEAR